MAEAAAAVSIVGTGAQVIAGIANAAGQAQQGRANAEISNYNAKVADQNAEAVSAQGDEMARRSLINSRKYLGQEMSGYAASGVSNDGSAQWVMRESAAQGELNALTIKNNAEVKATAYRNTANLDRYRAQNQIVSGDIGAASALLGTAGKLATGYMSPGGSQVENASSAIADGMGED